MSIEQRANIKFCFNLGKIFTETHQMMKRVYGDDCISRSRIHECFKRFQEGRQALEDDECSGRPRNVVNEENSEIVREFISKEPKSLLKYMESDIRRVDLSYCDRKLGVHNGLCQIWNAQSKTTRKRPQNS